MVLVPDFLGLGTIGHFFGTGVSLTNCVKAFGLGRKGSETTYVGVDGRSHASRSPNPSSPNDQLTTSARVAPQLRAAPPTIPKIRELRSAAISGRAVED